MTTQVIIDTHAGWDVEVVSEAIDSEGKIVSTSTKVIPKNCKDSIYIHSHLRIVSIKELPNN